MNDRWTRGAWVSRADVRLAAILFFMLTCLYWATATPYMDSVDAETMFAVTEGLVERGTFVQPEQAGGAPRSLARAPDGRLYAITGPLQSLLAIPFYIVGAWAATVFPPPFYPFVTRLFVMLFNGPICAAAASILYVFGVDLGYRRRAALFVSLTYGLATVAWPYGRTFFAETLHSLWLILTAWAVYRYAHTAKWKWAAIGGAAMGLGLATKYVMAVAAPAFVLYLGLEFWRRPDWPTRWRWGGRLILAGATSCLVITGALMAFNYIRFGQLLETGYTRGDPTGAMGVWAATATPLTSLYSLFFSAGKGYFLFSPPTLLSLWGIPALARRRRNAAWLMLALAATYPLFYSLITSCWFGGSNWGPRYIVCITPFLVLPIGAWLDERPDLGYWRRAGAVALFVVGCWVQISHLLVNYNTYLFSDVPFDHQLFHPADSPLAAQWRLWPRQTRAWLEYDHALRASGESFYLIDGGFHPTEVPELAPWGRWMGEGGTLRLYARPAQALTIEIAYSRPRQADAGGGWDGLHWRYDGAPVRSDRRLAGEDERETRWIERVTLPADAVHIMPGTLEITATTWTPLESGDPRALSVFIERVEAISDGAPLPYRQANLPRPLPVSTAYPWSWKAMFWFYDPANARPFDMWPWYIWTSGVPLPKARLFIIICSLVLGSGLVTSTAWLISECKRNLR